MKQRRKTVGIIDRRFSEVIQYLEDAEDMAKVFEREKQKGDRTTTQYLLSIGTDTLFNLEEEELTHYGQSLLSTNYFGDGLDSSDEA